ncbi:MAG TPA: Hsp20/alpha crystallin family protein [Chitinophagaceae bacterium]
MTRKTDIKTDYSLIYPGIYHAPPKITSSLLGRLKRSGTEHSRPYLTMTELPDHFKVELFAPGLKREDFVVNVKNCRLVVYGLHRNEHLQETYGHHAEREFDYCFHHSVLLPKNADTDFVSAEYKNGILCLIFPKSFKDCESRRHSVVVY